MSNFYLAFGPLFVSMIIARVISIKALNRLSPAQKAELVTSFSWVQLYSLIGIVIFIAVYFWLSSSSMNHTPVTVLTLYGVLSGLFILYNQPKSGP